MTGRSKPKYEALLISNMPWEGSGMTNRQAWAIALARMNMSSATLFIETIGWNPLPRAPKRVYTETTGGEVWTVRAWNLLPGAARPGHKLARKVNHTLTRVLLKIWGVRRVKNVVVFDPFARAIATGIRRDRLVYDCLDLYEAQPQYSQDQSAPAAFEEYERELCASADVVSAVTSSLATRLVKLGAKNVVSAPGALPAPGELSPPKVHARGAMVPRGIYIGALDSYKVDYAIFHKLLDIHPHLEIDVYGGRQYEERDSSAALPSSRRFRIRKSVVRDEAIRLAAEYDFGIIAMTRSSYSVGSFPLKTWDYLWAGIPILAVNFQASEEIPKLASMLLLDDADELSVGMLHSLLESKNADSIEEMRRIASESSAEARVKRIIG